MSVSYGSFEIIGIMLSQEQFYKLFDAVVEHEVSNILSCPVGHTAGFKYCPECGEKCSALVKHEDIKLSDILAADTLEYHQDLGEHVKWLRGVFIGKEYGDVNYIDDDWVGYVGMEEEADDTKQAVLELLSRAGMNTVDLNLERHCVHYLSY